jgi:hypothetical protein
MKKLLTSSLALSALIASAGAASAEGVHASAGFVTATAGTMTVEVGPDSADFDLKTAFGVAAAVDYDVLPFLSVGIAPRLFFGVKPSDEVFENSDAAKILDLRARVTGFHEVAPKLTLFGYFAPGYSLMMSADDSEDGGSDPKGLVVGVGGGANYAVTPQIFVGADVGYQLGFQKGTVVNSEGAEIDADAGIRYLTVGLNAGSTF